MLFSQPGRDLLAAGYALYSSATLLVLSTGLGVNGFTLDPSIGEFILTHPSIRIPEKGKLYSVNESNSANWDQPTRDWVDRCKQQGKSSRYGGSMVGDVHRVLLYGGVFAYPADKKSPQGKLRLLYECNPMSFIIEQAGGKSTTGHQRVLDVTPRALHQRCPIFCGSKSDVEEIEAMFKGSGIKLPAQL